jgi:3,5-epimerase/4-reductase
MKWLIFGSKGYIGKQVVDILEKLNETVISSKFRADDEKNVEDEIINIRPDRIISLIGRTHGPGVNTIDYLELPGKLRENINDNLYSPMVLAILSDRHDIHLTYMSTGCIFNGYKGYTEDDVPDFFGSGYSTVKGFTDRLMHLFKNVLNVRIRMPITADHNPRNFITKIIKYEKICSMKNSMTVLPELLPIMIDMAIKKETGTINLTNPGMISHNEILQMYKDINDPDFTWQNFEIDEQDKVLLSKRSNNLLSTEKLEHMYNVLSIYDAVEKTLRSLPVKSLF